MNSTQRKYARERISDIYDDKCKAIYTELKKKCKEYTSAELETGIKSGKIKAIKRSKVIDRWTQVRDVFELPKEAFSQDLKETPEYAKRVGKLDKEYRKVIDQLMLGDAKEGLTLIEKFAAMDF